MYFRYILIHTVVCRYNYMYMYIYYTKLQYSCLTKHYRLQNVDTITIHEMICFLSVTRCLK